MKVCDPRHHPMCDPYGSRASAPSPSPSPSPSPPPSPQGAIHSAHGRVHGSCRWPPASIVLVLLHARRELHSRELHSRELHSRELPSRRRRHGALCARVTHLTRRASRRPGRRAQRCLLRRIFGQQPCQKNMRTLFRGRHKGFQSTL